MGPLPRSPRLSAKKAPMLITPAKDLECSSAIRTAMREPPEKPVA